MLLYIFSFVQFLYFVYLMYYFCCCCYHACCCYVFFSVCFCLFCLFLRDVRMQLLNNSMVVQNNYYLTKTLNFYIVYDLDFRSRNLFIALLPKNYFCGTSNIVKNIDKINICIAAMKYH